MPTHLILVPGFLGFQRLGTMSYFVKQAQGEFKACDGGGSPVGGAAMAHGAAPVLVTLPLQGKETYFEKLLALDETLEVTFDFRGLRR